MMVEIGGMLLNPDYVAAVQRGYEYPDDVKLPPESPRKFATVLMMSGEWITVNASYEYAKAVLT